MPNHFLSCDTLYLASLKYKTIVLPRTASIDLHAAVALFIFTFSGLECMYHRLGDLAIFCKRSDKTIAANYRYKCGITCPGCCIIFRPEMWKNVSRQKCYEHARKATAIDALATVGGSSQFPRAQMRYPRIDSRIPQPQLCDRGCNQWISILENKV